MDRVSVLEWRGGPEKGPSVYRKTDLLVNAPKIGKENRFMPRRRRNTIEYAKLNQNTIIYTKKPSSHYACKDLGLLSGLLLNCCSHASPHAELKVKATFQLIRELHPLQIHQFYGK